MGVNRVEINGNSKSVAVKHYECLSSALCVGSIVSIPEADQKEWENGRSMPGAELTATLCVLLSPLSP